MSNKDSLPKTIWILALALLCVGAGQSIIFITVPPAARDLGLSEIQIGLIFSSSAIAWMIFSPYWGNLSDSVGRKRVVLIGLFGFAISLCLFSVCISLGNSGYISGLLLFMLLILSRTINGLFGSATRPACGGWIADITSIEERSRAFARFDSGFSAGRIIGPGIAGFLLLISYNLPFYLFSLLAILAGSLIFFLPDIKKTNHFSESISNISFFDKKVFPFILIAGMYGIANATLVQTSSFYFQDVIYQNSGDFIFYSSLGFMIMGAGYLFGQLLIADRFKVQPGYLIRTGSILISGGLLLIAYSESLFSIYLALSIYGLGAGMLGPGLSSSLSISVGQGKQGLANGFMSMVIPLGHILSPFLSMPLYSVNSSYPYFLSSFLMLIAFIYILFNKRHKWIRDKSYLIN
ncbi:MAG: MFS transporter [SAR86 cluster bacterium]|jgi:MFS family permease|nr:MFS transporter [SAR86 cluster bacterium]